jgi:hypothetical protein
LYRAEKKHRDDFNRTAKYVGNGIYAIAGVQSTDTRELFLMYCAICEGIKFKID